MPHIDLLRALNWSTTDLPEHLRLRALSDGDVDDEDVFGETPIALRATGRTLRGDTLLNRPDSPKYLVVDGDLTINGRLVLSAWDDCSVLVVTGNLNAEAVFVDADVQLVVLGDCTADLIWLGLSDIGFVRFAGHLVADVLVHSGRGEVVSTAEWNDDVPTRHAAIVSAIPTSALDDIFGPCQ